MIFETTTLRRYEQWLNFASSSGCYINAKGQLFFWVSVPEHYRILISLI